MNKPILYAVLSAAVIIGFSLIYAALIEQGIIFQPAGSRQKGQVIATPAQHVNLGVIYTESKMLDVSLVTKHRPADSGQTELLALKGINPYDYDLVIAEALKKSIIDKLAAYKVPYNMKGTIDNVTLSHEGLLVVKTYVKYNTEYHPDFRLDIITRTYTLSPEEPVARFILKKAKRIIENSHRHYNKNMFLAGDNTPQKSKEGN